MNNLALSIPCVLLLAACQQEKREAPAPLVPSSKSSPIAQNTPREEKLVRPPPEAAPAPKPKPPPSDGAAGADVALEPPAIDVSELGELQVISIEDAVHQATELIHEKNADAELQKLKQEIMGGG